MQEHLTFKDYLIDICKLLIDIPYCVYLLISCLIGSLIKRLTAPEKDLTSETVLVTGAATGLGRAVVQEIAKRFQTTLVLWDINEEELRKTVNACKALGSKVFYYVLDLSKDNEIVNTAELVRRDVGPITILYNNAGLAYVAPFEQGDSELEEKVIQVNLLSYMKTIKQFLPDMIRAGRGHIVSTCSALAFFRFRYVTSYTASKYGLRGFIESLKLEMNVHPKKPRIAFTTVYPGWIRTPMTEGISWKPRYHIKALMPLDASWVAEKVVDGIVREEEEVILPHNSKLMGVFCWFLPTKFLDALDQHLYQDINRCNESTSVKNYNDSKKKCASTKPVPKKNKK